MERLRLELVYNGYQLLCKGGLQVRKVFTNNCLYVCLSYKIIKTNKIQILDITYAWIRSEKEISNQ